MSENAYPVEVFVSAESPSEAELYVRNMLQDGVRWDELLEVGVSLPEPGDPRRCQRAEVYTAQVEGREDGLYVFGDPGDRNAFATAVESEDGTCVRETEPVNDEAATKRLIAAEVEAGQVEERERTQATERGDQLEALGWPSLAADVRTGLPLRDALLCLRDIGESDSEAATMIRSWKYGIPQ